MLRHVLLACFAVFTVATMAARADTNAVSGPILVIGPDMQLSARSAAGDLLTRPDWSQLAQASVAHALEERFRASNRRVQFVDGNTLMQGRAGQLLRLHAMVAESAVASQRGRQRGPRSRWTIGPGADDIGAAYSADYALIVGGDGEYSSTTRGLIGIASNIRTAAAAVAGNPGAAASLGWHAFHRGDGGRRMLASLVDLHSGDIIWIRQISDGRDDPRTPEGARRLLNKLLKDAPL